MEQWHTLVQRGDAVAEILDEMERGGLVAARRYLDANGIDYTEVSE